MIDRDDFEYWVIDSLKALGGSASISEIAKCIWDNHKRTIEITPFLYSWQYEMRWAATSLRKKGKLKKVSLSPKGVWELAL
jgi:hypothetical protein